MEENTTSEEMEKTSGLEAEERMWRLFPRLREEAPLSIFIQEYSCMCQTEEDRLPHQGELFITTEHIAFYSSIIGDYKMVVPFADIRTITKTKTAWLIPNAITITRFRGRMKDPKHYNFTNLFSRDETFRVLIAAWEEVKRKVIQEEGTQMIPILDPSTSKPELSRDSPKPKLNERSSPFFHGGTNPTSRTLSIFCDHFAMSLQKIVCHEDTFPVSVQGFYDHFLSDESGYWLKFYESRPKEFSSVNMSFWTVSSPECCFTRNVRFTIPNAASTSESASIDQVQHCRLYDPNTLQFKFSNSSETLAYGDCFVVESSWVIKNIPDEQNRCRVDFFVHLLWTKRTMFKSVIEKASIDRTKDFILKWVSDAKEYLNGPQKGGNAFDGSSPSRNISSSSGPRRRSTSSRTEGRPAEKEQSGSFLMGIFYFFLLGLIGLGLYLDYQSSVLDSELQSWTHRNALLEDQILFLRDVLQKLIMNHTGATGLSAQIPSVPDGGVYAEVIQMQSLVRELEVRIAEKEIVLNQMTHQIRNSAILNSFGSVNDLEDGFGLTLLNTVVPVLVLISILYILRKIFVNG